MRWADVGLRSSEAAGRYTGTVSTELGVLSGGLLWLALPEAGLAGTRSVVISWRWAEALLLLMVTDKENLHQRSDEEEEAAMLLAQKS